MSFRCLLFFQVTTSICYHHVKRLSTSFFIYFKLVYFRSPFVSATDSIISPILIHVNDFFNFFVFFIFLRFPALFLLLRGLGYLNSGVSSKELTRFRVFNKGGALCG